MKNSFWVCSFLSGEAICEEGAVEKKQVLGNWRRQMGYVDKLLLLWVGVFVLIVFKLTENYHRRVLPWVAANTGIYAVSPCGSAALRI